MHLDGERIFADQTEVGQTAGPATAGAAVDRNHGPGDRGGGVLHSHSGGRCSRQQRYAGCKFYPGSSFGGISASAIGLCHYLLNYWEGGHARSPGNYGWNYTFFGSLPGATAVLYQNISQTTTATNGLEFAALFNERTAATPGTDNSDALAAILAASNSITSWPAAGGGMVQWAVGSTNVNQSAASVTVALVRSGGSSLPVKVSYTTYALTAGNSNFTATAGIASFAAGVTTTNITVPLLNDHVPGPTRKFSLELISASGGASLGNQLSAVVNLLDTRIPPRFTGQPGFLPNGDFHFQFTGSTNLILTVQASTNLATWESLQTFTNVAAVSGFTDATPTHIHPFYRIVSP